MKNKGIPFIEQHVEKIVLGVAGAVFFSVVAWQFLGSPNSVKLDGASVAPGDIDAALADKTRILSSKMSGQQAPLATQLGDKVKPSAPLYDAAVAKSLSPSGTLPTIEPRLASVLQSDGAAGGQMFHVPQFAAVAMRDTRQVSDTLDASYVGQHDALKARFSTPSMPLDITWAVPSAVVDVGQIRRELEATRDGAQVPKIWYRGTLFVIDVSFERERKLDGGAWGDRTQVDALPGAFSFRPEIAKGADAGLRDGAFTFLAEKTNQLQIIQPDFLPTKCGNFSSGLMLAEDGAAAGEDPDVRRLRRQLAIQTENANRLEEELKELGGPLEDTSKEDKKKEEQRQKEEERQNQGGGSSGGGGGGGRPPGGGLSGGGMSGGKNTGGGANPRDEATKEKRIRMTKGLKELRKKAASTEALLSKKLEDLGQKLEQEKASVAASSDLAKADSIVVWGHDIGVQPAQTYRYRCVVKTYNPFFTNGSLLVSDQKSLGNDFTLDTKVSGWSEPFEVSPPVAFFVVDASAGEGRLGVGQATVEVFRYFDGKRHQERFTVQPGDAIGARAADGPVDFSTGYYLVDVLADPASDRGGVDRRPVAIAVVQSSTGERYEVRVPRTDIMDPLRIAFEDEIALGKDDAAAPKDAGKTDGAAGGTPDAPRSGDPKDPNYGPRG
ncbi:MAG: hypothetical protein ACKOYN_11475 [Planctomycetota bacterium]